RIPGSATAAADKAPFWIPNILTAAKHSDVAANATITSLRDTLIEPSQSKSGSIDNARFAPGLAVMGPGTLQACRRGVCLRSFFNASYVYDAARYASS